MEWRERVGNRPNEKGRPKAAFPELHRV